MSKENNPEATLKGNKGATDILDSILADAPLHTNKSVAVQKKKRIDNPKPSAAKAIAAGDRQGVIDSLTGKQLRFVEAYVIEPNGAKAVLEAGYQTNNANRMAFQLLEKPAVKLSIDYLRAERSKYSDVTKDYVLDKIVKALESAESKDQYTAVLRAAELLAKHLGMFVDRTEISGPDGKAIELEQRTKQTADEFTNKLKRLANSGGKVVEFPSGNERDSNDD